MKRTLILVAVLLCTCSVARAETPAPASDLFAGSGGGCVLPDLAGLSPEQIAAAALGAGFQPSPSEKQVPICPVKFDCTSLTGCAAGPACTLTDIGPCCATSGAVICCTSGTIKVVRCPCQCTSTVCSTTVCTSSTDVKWHCS